MEIKFRCYCDKHKRWEYYSLGDLICGATLTENGEGGIFKWWGRYTGLNDKNRIYVFEGDILDFEAREWGMPGFKSAVEWDLKTASWDFGGGTSSDVSVYRKVVGNIYETPELLT